MEYERPVVALDLMPTARPRPWPSGSGSSQPIMALAFSTVSGQSPSAGVSPGTTSSPRVARLRSRISTRSMPRARAAASMFDSTAQLTCGVPKPRKAMAGVVLDRIERAVMRTVGTLYGPAAVYWLLATTRSAMSA